MVRLVSANDDSSCIKSIRPLFENPGRLLVDDPSFEAPIYARLTEVRCQENLQSIRS